MGTMGAVTEVPITFDAAANIAQAYSMWSADGGSFCPGQWCV